MPAFQLDSRLQADTLPITGLSLCSVQLMNDARWPWLVLVPNVPEAIELHDLSKDDQSRLLDETIMAGRALKAVTACEKINTGALGNIVRQLHVHVVARNPGDANWPGPIWGFGTKAPYEKERADRMIANIRAEFGKPA